MSRLRDAVLRADRGQVSVLAEILGEYDIAHYTAPWPSVRRYVAEHVPAACSSYQPDDVDYDVLLNYALTCLKITNLYGRSSIEKETAIVTEMLTRVEASKKFDRQGLLSAISAHATGYERDAATTSLQSGGLLALLKAGGFGTYLAMTTAMHAAAGTVGITLPFLVYASASSTLGLILCPIGFTALGVAVAWRYLSGANAKRAATVTLICLWTAAVMGAPK